MMFWYGGGWALWQVALMTLGMIAFLSLLIWAVYALVVASNRSASPRQRGDGPHLILQRRLARGEIDTEEYRRLWEVLATGAAPETRAAP